MVDCVTGLVVFMGFGNKVAWGGVMLCAWGHSYSWGATVVNWGTRRTDERGARGGRTIGGAWRVGDGWQVADEGGARASGHGTCRREIGRGTEPT